MENNEQEARKLDEEFKLGLVAIRPYILRLTSIEDATLCRQWICKLHDSVEERLVRNNLLKELTEQVKSGGLYDPFNIPPTEQPISLIKNTHEIIDQQDWSDDAYSFISYQGSDFVESTCQFENYEGRRSCNDTKIPFRRRSEPFAMSKWKQHEEKEIEQPMEACDVPPDNNENIQSLFNTIASLKAQNEALTHEVQLYQKTSQRTQKNLNSVNKEVVALRAKLSELQRINNNIEKSHVSAINEYRKTLNESLTMVSDRLKEVSERNEELVNNIAHLESVITQGEQQYEVNEKKLNNEICALQEQINSERKKKQSEIDHLKSIISEKNEQLRRMDSQVKKKCNRMQEEVSNIKSEITQAASESYSQLKEKITSLKRDVSRLEKTNKKLVAEYEARLKNQSLRRGNDKKMKVKHGNTNIEESINLELTVIELEQKYRKIVSDLEARAALQRNRDAQLDEYGAGHRKLLNKYNKRDCRVVIS